MEFGFTEEQNLLRESVRRFMRKECTREYVRECSRTYRFPIELYDKMAAQGWMGIPFPEKYGGAGLGPMELAIFLEEAGYAWYGAGTSYFCSVVLGAYNILLYGAEWQREPGAELADAHQHLRGVLGIFHHQRFGQLQLERAAQHR